MNDPDTRNAGTPVSLKTIAISQLSLFVFALGLRLYHLDHESLWMDELYQVSFYPFSFRQIIHLAAAQQQPPLDYWIGHVVWMFSQSDFAVRLPSAVFGAGSVLMLAVLAGKAASWRVGIGSGLIAALLPFNIHYSREARPYAISIFFFLVMLWALARLLESKKKLPIRSAILFLFSIAFLYTRSLSPMIVVTALAGILAVWLAGAHASGRERKPAIAALATLCLSFIAWLPGLKLILSKSGQYVSDASFGLGTIAKGISRFDITPAWRAFVTQADPLALPLLLLFACALPAIAIKSELVKKHALSKICIWLLPAALVLNLFVFQAKTANSFKPAYAIYLLPLALILAGVAFEALWRAAGKFRHARPARLVLMLTGAAMIIVAGISAIGFEGKRKKHDWRETAAFLSKNFGPGHVLIFDALGPHGGWEPAFFGFPRYYSGASKLITMSQIPEAGKRRAADTSLKPVAVLYLNRRILPRQSVFLPQKSEYQCFGGKDDSDLSVDEFTGFAIVRLRENTNGFSKDAYRLIEKILPYLPEDSTVVDLHLAAAALAEKTGNTGGKAHLDKALKFVPEEKRKSVREREMEITDMPFNK